MTNVVTDKRSIRSLFPSYLDYSPAGMGASVSAPAPVPNTVLGGQQAQVLIDDLEGSSETYIQDLPEDLLAKALVGSEPPFRHRQVSRQLRDLFDESRTQLRIQDLLCSSNTSARAPIRPPLPTS